MMELNRLLPAAARLILIVVAAVTSNVLDAAVHEEPPRVHPRFELAVRSGSPFPSDIYTVRDASQATRRRVNLPYPDCVARPSDCEDLDLINTLDGFGLQSRLSIPFDGAIDPLTVSSDDVFVISRSSTHTDSNPGGEVSLLPNTLYYRHDWAFAQDPNIPKNPHMVVVSPTAPNALFRSVSRGAQAQIADFHASGGTIVNLPEPAGLWEVPMVERPDSLNFIR